VEAEDDGSAESVIESDRTVRLRAALLMARQGEAAVLTREIANRFYSNETSLVLRRDLWERYAVAHPSADIHLRLLETRDFNQVIRERPRRLPVLLANIPDCYVAATSAGELAFMVWVVSSEDWPRFKCHFKGDLWRPLRPDECLFEFAYTFKKFRAQGVMAASLNLIADRLYAERRWLRWAYNFVRKENVPSLKGCRKAGFAPIMLRHEQWRALHLRQSFDVLPPGTTYPFEHK
jgi:hypothetical protein